MAGPNPSTALGTYNSATQTVADGQSFPLQTDVNGNLKVSIGGSGGGSNLATNIAQYGGTNVGPTNPFNVTGAVAKLSTSLDWKYAALTGGITDTADVVLHAAAGANLYNTLDSLQYVNKNASTSTEIVVKDGSTVIWRGWAPATIALVTPLQMVPVTFDPPLQSSANTALNFACITTGTATYINAQGSVVG